MTELPPRLNQNSQSSFYGQADMSGNPQSTGSSKIFKKAMTRPPNAIIPDRYNFPSLGLKIQGKEKVAFHSTNPFLVHENDEMLLLAQENKRRSKELDSKQRTHISLKPIATRTDRSGRISSIKGIRPLPRKPSFNEDQLRKDLILGKRHEQEVLLTMNTAKRGLSQDGLALVPSSGEKINLFQHPDISIDELKAIEAVQAGIEEEEQDGQPSKLSEGHRKKGANLNYLKQGMKRESTREYVLQVRKIFMTGFAIENKKEETKNLEDYIKNEEEKLANAKKVFKEDQEKFDKYHLNLKQQASKVSKDLEKEAKRKMQKLSDIQELNEEIKLIQVDINKRKQELDDLHACRSFLVKLRGPQGPPVSISQSRSQVSSRYPIQRLPANLPSGPSKRKESTFTTASKQKQLLASDTGMESSVFLTGMKDVPSGSLERGSEMSRQKHRDHLSPSPASISPGVVGEKLTEEEAKYYLDEEEEHAVPFEDPKELLEIVQELEEKNLFLIDIEQNNENTLEKMVRNYEQELKLVNRQYTEIKSNVKNLEEKAKLMKQREDKLRREIKTLQNGGASKGSPPRRGIDPRGQSGPVGEAVLSSSQHIERVRREVVEVYKLCEKNPSNQASLLEMLKTIELHVQTKNQQREYMIAQGKPVEEQEVRFKNIRRQEKGKQHMNLQKEKERERERKLEKKKEQMRYVFKGHRDVFRTKPVESKQKQSSQNKGDKHQEEIIKYLELNTASETSRQLMESLLNSQHARPEPKEDTKIGWRAIESRKGMSEVSSSKRV